MSNSREGRVLQRNALSLPQCPTGNEVDEDSIDSDIGEKDHDISSRIGFHKLRKPRVPQTSEELVNHGIDRDFQSITHNSQPKVNLALLRTDSLRRYCRHYNLANISSDSSREQMLDAVQQHFVSQPVLSEMDVISEFVNTANKRKPVDRNKQ